MCVAHVSCRKVSLEGVPEDPLWPSSDQLLQLLETRLGAAVHTKVCCWWRSWLGTGQFAAPLRSKRTPNPSMLCLSRGVEAFIGQSRALVQDCSTADIAAWRDPADGLIGALCVERRVEKWTGRAEGRSPPGAVPHPGPQETSFLRATPYTEWSSYGALVALCPVCLQDIEADCSRLLATGLFGRARPAAVPAKRGEAPQFGAVIPEQDEDEDAAQGSKVREGGTSCHQTKAEPLIRGVSMAGIRDRR